MTKPHWSIGVLELWSIEAILSSIFLVSLLHYSKTPFNIKQTFMFSKILTSIQKELAP